MDPTNGRVALVVSSDSSERFPLRSALNHGATNVPPHVVHSKRPNFYFFAGIAGAKEESESRRIGILIDASHVAPASRCG
jgi:hypothetical protein